MKDMLKILESLVGENNSYFSVEKLIKEAKEHLYWRDDI